MEKYGGTVLDDFRGKWEQQQQHEVGDLSLC